MTKPMTTTRPASTGHPGYSETHPCVEATAAVAHILVRDAFGTWGLDHLAERGTLIISEFVTNAVKHTRCRSIRITVDRPSEAWVRVAVVDRAASLLPEIRPPATEDESGRGLVLVDALADRWSYALLGSHPKRGPWGKTVYAELKVSSR
ncbi:ATP-binding protein [Streptomyces sp. MCAF7]